MEIFELAKELGQTLKKDDRLIRLENARMAYEADHELGKKMVEYEVQQKALSNEMVKEERDTQFVDVIQNRINQLYKEITESPIFAELNEAQAVVNELMNSVNSAIMYEITGEIPGSCTGNCSSCGGSCHHD